MNRTNLAKKVSIIEILLLCGSFLVSTSALAECFNIKVGIPVIVARDGQVIAKFLGNGQAVYSNDLYLDSPSGGFQGVIFNNLTSPIGSTVNLGFFKAGTELVFRIHVNDTNRDLITGLASRNADGAVHARVSDSESETIVGFEDLEAGGPPDGSCPSGGYSFDDLVFSFTNVRADASIGGSVTSLNLLQVICRNVTTGKKIKFTVPGQGISWDCANAGLNANPGDTIQQTLLGKIR